MPKTPTPLTETKVKSLKAADKDQVLSDGNGLQLRVRANGSKLWNFNYLHPITKKRLNMGLGKYPDVGLARARSLAVDARALLAEGKDPKAQRELETTQAKAAVDNTLLKVAEGWFEVKRDSVTPDYADDIWRSLELYIFPTLGKAPIVEITAPQVIDLLRPVERDGKLETVKRVSQRLNEVMTYAVNSGLIHANPLSGIRQTFKAPKKEHLPTIKPDQLPEFMSKLYNTNMRTLTRYLILWQLHTMTRPSEAAGARWDEIDEQMRVWTIPAERMKKRKEHKVPLSGPVMKLLEEIRAHSGKRAFLFPSANNPNKPMSSQTANAAISRGMKYGNALVSHGLRSLASTTLNEAGKDPDLIEAALAHRGSDQVRNAYNRADYLERRRELMEWWSAKIINSSFQ